MKPGRPRLLHDLFLGLSSQSKHMESRKMKPAYES